jgi:hypothetical protein
MRFDIQYGQQTTGLTCKTVVPLEHWIQPASWVELMVRRSGDELEFMGVPLGESGLTLLEHEGWHVILKKVPPIQLDVDLRRIRNRLAQRQQNGL